MFYLEFLLKLISCIGVNLLQIEINLYILNIPYKSFVKRKKMRFCMQETRCFSLSSVRFCRYKNISRLPPFLFQQNQLVRDGFSDFTFRSMFCPPGHSTSDGREMGTGKGGEV